MSTIAFDAYADPRANVTMSVRQSFLSRAFEEIDRMDIPSLILGGIVLGCTIILEIRNRRGHGGHHDDEVTDLDRRYLHGRGRRRRLVHVVLAIVSVLALTAGFLGHGGEFALIWAAVPLLIVVVVLLAMTDAYQTYRYHDAKLPEVRQASFPEYENGMAGDDNR